MGERSRPAPRAGERIGLAIVAAIAQERKGQVHLEARDRHGTGSAYGSRLTVPADTRHAARAATPVYPRQARYPGLADTGDHSQPSYPPYHAARGTATPADLYRSQVVLDPYANPPPRQH